RPASAARRDSRSPRRSWAGRCRSRQFQRTVTADAQATIEWSRLGFIVRNPYQPGAKSADDLTYKYISVERS
ncbi:hypothetical protein FNJ47_48955, partial [Bradyrhizobium sp. UFLA 03-164]|nr:hypothetical protein [Bradyrhizobium uaiense]